MRFIPSNVLPVECPEWFEVLARLVVVVASRSRAASPVGTPSSGLRMQTVYKTGHRPKTVRNRRQLLFKKLLAGKHLPSYRIS